MRNKFWKGKRVIVTGAGGFLGSHFVSELKLIGIEVIPVTRKKVDLLDFNKTKEVLRDADIIINCAALDGNSEFKKSHAAQILDCNLRITLNILNAAKENNIKNIVLVSSAEIYSSNAPNPIKEEDDYRQYDGHTTSGYILSKRFVEILSDLYKEEFGLKIFLPRPSNIFGPGDHFEDDSTRVIPSFINKIISGEPIEIWGDGSQTRQFIYVKNVVYTVLAMVEQGLDERLNISSNESVSILELAKMVFNILGIEPDIHLDRAKSMGVHSRILDVSKMHRLIGFVPISLEVGLEETVKWYKGENQR